MKKAVELIRATKTWQRAGVYYVRTQAVVKESHIPLYEEFDESDKEDTPYVLVLDGIYPVAACRVHFVDDKLAKIERVCVLKEYRKHGIGKMLIEGAEKWIKEEGIKKIVITSREEAVGFYQALGYRADFKKIYDGGVFKTIYTEKMIG